MNRQLFSIVAAGVAASLVVVGCGSDDDEPAAEPATTAQAEESDDASSTTAVGAEAESEGPVSSYAGVFPGSVERGDLAQEANERYEIIMLSGSDVIPGWNGYNIGARAAAEELGVEFEIVQFASLEPTDLVAGVNAVTASGPDAALVSAVNDQAMQSAMEAAADEGIEIVVFDSPPVDPSFALSYVGSPAETLGRVAADALAELIGAEGTVLHTDAAPSFSNLVINQEAFREQMAAEYPDVNLLPLEYDEGDVSNNASIMRATLSRHPDLAGAYLGTSGLGGRGGVTALKEADRAGDVAVVTLDGLPGAIEDLRDGSQHVVTSVQLFDLGWLALEAAVASLNGDDVPATIDSGYCVLTRENIDDPDVAESYCIYPTES